MRTLFYHTSHHWTGASRAFAVAARGMAARGEQVVVMCVGGARVEQNFLKEGLEVVHAELGVGTAESWRLRKVLKEKFIEVVFVHSEREHLVASSALRLAERGVVIRRIPAGGSIGAGKSGKLAAKMGSSRLLFTTEADRARSGLADGAFLAPLGVDTVRLEGARDKSRTTLTVAEGTRLMVCVVDDRSGHRVTTALRTLALLAERHPALRLVIVGRCADEDDMRMHAAALGVTTLVRFLGERDDMPEVLAAADVGWVATEGDEGAFSCLDFMSARVPVIAERSPLLSHYVPDGIAGVHLPAADPSDTASAVARFLADENQRAAMGNAGRTRVMRDFGEAAMIDGFVEASHAAGDRAAWAAR
ncbi:MAG: glycosyl transferase group 1 [Gemmatimonadetes bacterium]|nr:glycosyl transferase group 1 [Gemmatimonadota bacterium]